MCWKLIAIFNLLKIRMRVDIFGIEKCKVTFGLKYIKMSLCFSVCIRHDYVKLSCSRKKILFLANVMFLILIYTAAFT